MALIELKNLTYTYGAGLPGAVTAVNDVSLAIERGSFTGLIGHTGCGKSTLVAHLNGLNKPTGGQYIFDGESVFEKGYNLKQLRFQVGLVFQYPEYQLFEETVFKDIAFGPKNMGLPPEEVEQRVLEAAELCGVDKEFMQRSPFELSGGQKRKVAIAGVIAMRPKVLVLDEPAAGLDPSGREQILGMIKTYHEKTGATVILVSHSMEDIARFAQRVIVMQEGRVVMHDETEKIFANVQMLTEMGLSVPLVTKVFIELKNRGFLNNTDVYTMDYAVKTLLKLKGGKADGNA